MSIISHQANELWSQLQLDELKKIRGDRNRDTVLFQEVVEGLRHRRLMQ